MHPIFCAHLIIFLGLLNLDIATPPLECLHCLFVCNLQFNHISFLNIQTLHNDCTHIEDVHRRRRSRAEFGLVLNIIELQHEISNNMVRATSKGFDQSSCRLIGDFAWFKRK